MAEGENRRRGVPPWASRLGKGAKSGWSKVRNTATALAERLASSPQALAALAGALATVSLGVGVGTAVHTNGVTDRLEAIERTVSEAESLLADMAAEVGELQGSTDLLVTDVGALAEAIANGDEEAAGDIATEASRRAAVLREQSARLEGLADKLTDLDDSTVGAEAVASVASDLRELTERLASTNATLDALAGNVEGVRADLDAAEGALASVSDTVGQLQADLLATNATVAALGSELDTVANAAVTAQVAADVAQETADAATERLTVSGADMTWAEDKLSFITLDIPVPGSYLITVSSKFVSYNPNGASAGSCRRTTRVDSRVIDTMTIAGNAPAGPSYQTSGLVTLEAGEVEIRTSHAANVPDATCTASAVIATAVLVS